MAVQQLGREEALREILSQRNAPIRNSIGPASGIGSYVAPSVTSTSGSGIGAVDPTLDYGLDSEMSGNIAIDGGQATEVPFVTPGFYTGMGKAVGQGLSSVFGYKGPSDEKTQREAIQSYINRDIPQMTDEELAAMEADEAAGIDSQLKQISQSLAEKAPADTVPSAVSESFGDKEQADAADTEAKADDPLEPFGGSGDDVQESPKNPAEEGFAAGMKEYLDALTGSDTGVKSIDEYKKEFADATGISIDGKPDKSAALMTFGLALMQNKAGKGFNVSNMLTALGEAGEKAAPELAAAKRAAKAEQLAAGKYALDARGAAITKAAATRQAIADRMAAISDRAYDRETQYELQQMKNDATLADRKMQEETARLKAEVEALASAGELGKPTKINLGGSGDEAFDIQVQQRGKSGEFKIIAPNAAMGRIDKRIQSADAGLKTVNKMQDLSSGGQTIGMKGIYTRMQDAFKGLFSIPAVEEGSDVEQYRAAVGSMLVRYRKLLTGGEAGNAISDRDVAIIRQNLGLPEGVTEIAFTSSSQVASYLSELEKLFKDRKALFVGQKGALVEFGQSSGYYTEEAKDDDYSDDYLGYVPQVVGGKLRLTLPK